MAVTAAAVPLRPGLFDVDAAGTHRLVGTRCETCGAHFFPRRRICARCRSSATRAVPLSTRGALYTYTTVYQSTPAFTTPYVLAYADLPEGVRLLAQLVAAPGAVRIGMPLELRVEPVGVDGEGRPVLGYRFHPPAETRDG
ncbi:MAG TPA: Zn-ribbon domain-containing OB-fold protein [bacterium]|nr:Zn-ribbon domain-containing OB-fold protein [bacterium]